MFPYSTSYSYYACLNYACNTQLQLLSALQESIIAFALDGYVKELRVWDYDMEAVHDHMLYNRHQIVYYYLRKKAKLSDYFRFLKYDSNADIFRRYMPASITTYGITVDLS